VALLTRITDAHIEDINQQWWAIAEQKFGTKFKVPTEEHSRHSSYLRALYCLQRWDGKGSPVSFLVYHNLPDDVIAEVVKIYCGLAVEEVDIETPVKRAAKWDAFLKWAADHVFEQFTTEQLTEESGFSYPTTLAYLQESPTFRKIKKGLWEIRDAKADRETQKNSNQ
jgi:hypothetical protein